MGLYAVLEIQFQFLVPESKMKEESKISLSLYKANLPWRVWMLNLSLWVNQSKAIIFKVSFQIEPISGNDRIYLLELSSLNPWAQHWTQNWARKDSWLECELLGSCWAQNEQPNAKWIDQQAWWLALIWTLGLMLDLSNMVHCRFGAGPDFLKFWHLYYLLTFLNVLSVWDALRKY